jgi:WS/DGAT/MGAT family acyltransferase
MNGRLSALDDSFLAVENASAHMHVGWAAAFKRPEGSEPPRFEDLRDHIAGRLCRAPRYRQRIASVPFGLNAPIWVDDERFDVERHVLPSNASSLRELADSCMSTQLRRDRPLWQICIADELEDGGIGLVGKVHHCMVDGIAAVELGSLLLDPTPDPPPADGDRWLPRKAPGAVQRLIGGMLDLVRSEASLVKLPARAVRSPGRIGEQLIEPARRARDALAESFRPAEPRAPVNQPITGARHLAWFSRPLEDLKRVGRPLGASVNDVLLASAAGGIRDYMRGHDRDPAPLKTMVPVNVREGDASEFGNRISFVFIDLPCDEPDPLRRLQNIHLEMTERKEAGLPEGGDAAMAAIKYLPRPAQHVIGRMIASPKTFNLTVSNIPGPREPMFMRGCELEAAYPVVPIADKHAVSIGMTTIRDQACFGLYAASEMLPDSDELAAAMNASLDGLLEQVSA